MYIVKPCIYETSNGEIPGFIICNSLSLGELDADLLYVNRYLHKKSMKSDDTAYQYSHRITKFLNFLELHEKTYLEADDEDIVRYMHTLQYEMDADLISIQQRISPAALSMYYYPVRGLYIYLYECRIPVRVDVQVIRSRGGKNSYLQGISESLPSPDLTLERAYQYGAPARDYLKWYTEEEKERMLSAFRNKRNQAIFSISLDGFRIDEILSCRIHDYDVDTGFLTPFRSKRKPDGSEQRTGKISERSMSLLADYLINERAAVETEAYANGNVISDAMFIVLKHGRDFGKPLSYRSFWMCLKTAARKAGFNERQIRTHSGRSTRANEVFTDWSKNPEKYTENDIKDIFGWKSMDSSAPYLNRNDRERQIAIADKMKELDNQLHERYAKKLRKDNDKK